mmetsp:Transcript_160969/g.285357  ORF Transcript_160969/g.285357 Transcript_160969/m.285357 type:complete len:512 (-) Transcript_160969:299-1834(-)
MLMLADLQPPRLLRLRSGPPQAYALHDLGEVTPKSAPSPVKLQRALTDPCAYSFEQISAPLSSAPGEVEEEAKRIAEDGKSYAKAEFQEYYRDAWQIKWDAAEVAKALPVRATKPAEVQEIREQDLEGTHSASRPANSTACDPELDGQSPNKTEDSWYYSEYRHLHHQMIMLEDKHRTGTYQEAMTGEPDAFKDKVVLDVGAGTGVLSIFAAQAGAKKVYAVEATNMAERAKAIVEANGLSDKVRVIKGVVETVELPEKVDMIVSEWMGMFLLRESMLDSVIYARDRWLKEDGALLPSHATLYMAPMKECEVVKNNRATFENDKHRWAKFEKEMMDRYDINFSCVKEDFLAEQRKFYLQTGLFAEMLKDSLCGTTAPFLHIDVGTVTVDSLVTPKVPCKCMMTIDRDGPVEGFLTWFDTNFKGSAGNPVSQVRNLTTEPKEDKFDPQTHWAQKAFAFIPPLECKKDDEIECTMWILRNPKNFRNLILQTEFTQWRQGQMIGTPINETYYVN